MLSKHREPKAARGGQERANDHAKRYTIYLVDAHLDRDEERTLAVWPSSTSVVLRQLCRRCFCERQPAYLGQLRAVAVCNWDQIMPCDNSKRALRHWSYAWVACQAQSDIRLCAAEHHLKSIITEAFACDLHRLPERVEDEGSEAAMCEYR